MAKHVIHHFFIRKQILFLFSIFTVKYSQTPIIDSQISYRRSKSSIQILKHAYKKPDMLIFKTKTESNTYSLCLNLFDLFFTFRQSNSLRDT